MDDTTWNRSKGDYIWKKEIDMHFDNDHKYVNWIPQTCVVILVAQDSPCFIKIMESLAKTNLR